MIVRLWSARTSEPQVNAYLEHFSRAVLPNLHRLEGYAGADVLARRAGGKMEILVVTRWRSSAAVRQFAGEDIEAAVVADEAAALLSDFDRRVRHYELAVSDSPGDTPTTEPTEG